MNFNQTLPFIMTIVIGYLCGSIPTGYLYCKSKGVNIFEVGSGNPGYTNVKRVLGKQEGRRVLLLDALKAYIPCIISALVFPYWLYEGLISTDQSMYFTIGNMAILYTGMGAVIGHSWPIFLDFKGGKGVATTLGVMMAFDVKYSLLLILIYKLVSSKTKYVSLGSLTAVFVLSLLSTILSIRNIYPFAFPYSYLVLPSCYIITIVCFIKHRSNILRLINGTENKKV